MAIIKRGNGQFQVRIVGLDGRVISGTFRTMREAEGQELKWKQEKRNKVLGTNTERRLTVGDFFEEWFADVSNETSKEVRSGWRDLQKQYRTYIIPVLGKYELRAVTPQMVKRVLIEMAKQGKSPQTQRLVYATMKKMFGDAVENYQCLGVNPVLRKIKPVVTIQEARHLNLNQIVKLLQHVDGKSYGLAIWIQLYLGLRVGELTALRWEDIDLDVGRIVIRRTYVPKMGQFRDYPKGGKQHSHSVPVELLEKLKEAKGRSKSELVITSLEGRVLPFKWYLATLERYCRELDIPVIGSHGLRHSTSELYIHHGATRDDLRRLFAHSTQSVTDRYVHDRGTNLEKVATVIRLFPIVPYPKMTQTEDFLKTAN